MRPPEIWIFSQMNRRPLMASQYFIMSLAIHSLFVAGAFLWATHFVGPGESIPDPVVVSLASELPGGGGGGSRPGLEVKALPAHLRSGMARARQVSRPVLAKPRLEDTIPPPVVTAPPVESAVVLTQAEPQETGPVPSAQPSSELSLFGEGSGSGGGIGSGTGSGVGPGLGSGSGGGSGSGSGISAGAGQGPGESLETLRKRYLKEHFAYIRDLILKNLTYPPQARTMGWQGALTVSFVIKVTGHVERLRVLRSSGYEILDRNVLETVRMVQPFPKPPVKAEIIIPVLYSLE